MTESKSKGAQLNSLLQELKSEYQRNFPDRLQQLRLDVESRRLEAATRGFHNLKGTGKTHGFPEITWICDAAEQDCQTQIPITGNWDFAERAIRLLEKIQRSWSNSTQYDLAKDPEAQDFLPRKSLR